MQLTCVRADPCGNTTALVLGDVPLSLRAAAAQEALRAFACEQGGFVCAPRLGGAGRLEMFGGEFCGNAARCFAAWLYAQSPAAFPLKNGRAAVPLELSGSDSLLTACVAPISEPDRFDVSCAMPLPRAIEPAEQEGKILTLCAFPGIVHLIAWDEAPSPERAATLLAFSQARYPKAEAFGVLFYDQTAGFLTPFVHVPGANTSVWEQSCASGSTAVACALSVRQARSLSLSLRQPGGALRLETCWDGGVSRAVAGGIVRLSPAKAFSF